MKNVTIVNTIRYRVAVDEKMVASRDQLEAPEVFGNENTNTRHKTGSKIHYSVLTYRQAGEVGEAGVIESSNLLSWGTRTAKMDGDAAYFPKNWPQQTASYR